MRDGSIHQAFTSALDALVEQIKADRSILAAILCGSLSHDTVWAGSDIDLVLVTIDDRKVERSDAALYADGINVHAFLMPRAEFRRTVDGSVQNSFMHAFLAKGRLLYSHDPTIAGLCDSLAALGSRDLQVQRLRAATGALACINKAHKWLLTRGDLDYTALWILYAATALAQIEVLNAGQLMDREVIPQALTLNRPFFSTIYVDLLNNRKTRATIEGALAAVDHYVSSRAASIFAPVIEHLQEAGEARSASDLEFHFARTMNVEGVTPACEYLADLGLLGKVALPRRLTKKSNAEVQELAFYAATRPDA